MRENSGSRYRNLSVRHAMFALNIDCGHGLASVRNGRQAFENLKERIVCGGGAGGTVRRHTCRWNAAFEA